MITSSSDFCGTRVARCLKDSQFHIVFCNIRLHCRSQKIWVKLFYPKILLNLKVSILFIETELIYGVLNLELISHELNDISHRALVGYLKKKHLKVSFDLMFFFLRECTPWTEIETGIVF